MLLSISNPITPSVQVLDTGDFDITTPFGENVIMTPSITGSGISAPTTIGLPDDLGGGGLELRAMNSGPSAPISTADSVVEIQPQSAVMLSGVPTSTWTYGCSATSAGMLFGYYDRNGYPDMYTGPTNGGVAPLTNLGQGDDPAHPIAGACSIIATQNGFDGRSTNGHVNDYWISYNSPGPDSWEGHWGEHTWSSCTADYMGTNQWKWDFLGGDGVKDFNVDGSTALFTSSTGAKLYDYIPSAGAGMPQTELCHGLRLFAESRGYSVVQNYTQKIDVLASGGFSFSDFCTEIDANRPVLIQLEGHTMVGMGYDTGNKIYVHDTWDNLTHSMTWGGSYSGMAHEAVTVIQLASTLQPPTLTAFSGPVDTTLEDTQAEITFAELAAKGDEADADGAVVAFVVKSAGGGTLLIGTSAATATAWVAGTNDTIDAAHHAYWMPALNANGNFNVFAVVAKDNDSLESATPVNVSIDVTPVNDAPVRTAPTTLTFTPVAEDSNNTTAVSLGLTGLTYGPGGGADEAGQTLTYTITAIPAFVQIFKPDGTTRINAGDAVSAAELQGLKFKTVANLNGAANLTWAVTDNGSGIAPNVNTLAESLLLTVYEVNDKPVAQIDEPITPEDTPMVIDADLLTENDTAGPENESDQSLTVIDVRAVADTHGTLEVLRDSLGNVIDVIYTPELNFHGLARFQYRVQDNGTTNGAADPIAVWGWVHVLVTEVNDPPVPVDDLGQTTWEDVPLSIPSGTLTANDSKGPVDENWQTLTVIDVKATADTHGTVTIIDGNVVYTPAENYYGPASFKYLVQDNGTTDEWPDPQPTSPYPESAWATVFVTVLPVNDFPRGTDGVVSTSEDERYPFEIADFGFADPSDLPDPDNFLAVKITTIPANGVLMLNGVPVTPGQFISVADIEADKLNYVPPANANGNPLDLFTFQVQDDGGTANGGVDLDLIPNTMTINVTPVNDAPEGTDGQITLLEDQIYHFNMSEFGFTDPLDIPPNHFAGVIITTLPALGTLKLDGVPVIPGQIVTSGVLTYEPVANANGAPYTNFTFQVMDDGGIANSGKNIDPTPNTLTINVTAVNDAPAGTDKTVAMLEDGVYTFAIGDFGFTDPVDSPPNAFNRLKITTLPGSGTLMIGDLPATLGEIIPVDHINLLTFRPAANANGSPYASFTFQVGDDGGTANGGVDLDPSPNKITFNVGPVNDAPSGTDKTVTVLEDSSYTFTLSDFGFSDSVDNPPNNFDGVYVSYCPNLYYDGNPIPPSGLYVPAAGITAGKLKFIPPANANGNPFCSFTFRVKDDGGTTNGGVDTDPTPNRMTINVTAVNDAPASENSVVTTLEDIAYAFKATDFKFTDPLDNPPNIFKAVEITTIPSVGTLKLDGTPVVPGQIVQVTDLTKLKYWPVANGNAIGIPYTDFKFRVQDNGGTANGGVDWSPAASPYTMSINVTAVNDAPAGTNKTVATPEDVPYIFARNDFGFSDPLDTPPNAFNRVVITTIPAAGKLKLNGIDVTPGQSIPISDIDAGLLKFFPTLNLFGSPFATFTFQVGDDGGVANGGVDLDQSPNVMTINVTSVNDSPVPFDDSTRIQEGESLAITANLLAVNDSPGPANEVGQLPLTVIGVFGDANAHGTLELVNGTITFTPEAHYNGPAMFYYLVQDSGPIDDPTIRREHGRDLTSNQAWGRVFVTVGEVNDAPIPVDDVVWTSKGVAKTIPAAALLANDSAGPYEAEQALTLLSVYGNSATHGTVALSNGIITYTPAAGYVGPAEFWYVVKDNGTTNGFLDPKQATGVVHVNVVDPAMHTTHIWDGGGSDNKWSTAANWEGDIAPTAGDDLVFPSGVAKTNIVNDIGSSTVFGSIIIDAGGGYQIQDLNGVHSSSSIEVLGNSTLNAKSIVADSLTIGGNGGGASAAAAVAETASAKTASLPCLVVDVAVESPVVVAPVQEDLPVVENSAVAAACLPEVVPPTPAANPSVSTADPIVTVAEATPLASIAAPMPWNAPEPVVSVAVAQELVKIEPIAFLPSVLREPVAVMMVLPGAVQKVDVQEAPVQPAARAVMPAAAAARDAVFENVAYEAELSADLWSTESQVKHKMQKLIDQAFQEDEDLFLLDAVL